MIESPTPHVHITFVLECEYISFSYSEIVIIIKKHSHVNSSTEQHMTIKMHYTIDYKYFIRKKYVYWMKEKNIPEQGINKYKPSERYTSCC